MTADLPNFEKELQINENIIVEEDILQTDNYKDWFDYFVEIYGKKRTNLHLFAINSLICFITKLFIAKYILNHDQYSSKIITEIDKIVKEKYDWQIISQELDRIYQELGYGKR